MKHKIPPVEGSRDGDTTNLGNGNDALPKRKREIEDGPSKPMYPPQDEYYWHDPKAYNPRPREDY